MKKLLLLLLCFAAIDCFAQPLNVWGLTQGGGAFGSGVLFEYNSLTHTITKKLDFDGSNGSNPGGGLLKAGNGRLYGTTTNGGTNGSGVLFEFDPVTGSYTQKINFDGTNGANPYGGLIEAANSKLYGMTNSGGANGSGVLFEFDPATNTYTQKLDFDGDNGANPYGNLIQAANGKLYGMTYSGGANGSGVLFEFDPATNTYTQKLDFDGDNGANPYGSLIQAANGKLYGMTSSGGTNYSGVLFEFDLATNAYTKKIDFDGNNGANPYGSLIQAANGKLYGMTYSGGTNYSGVLFEFDPATNTYTKKINFDGNNGGNPYGSLTQAVDGKLYGMTNIDYTNWSGLMFEYDPATSTSNTLAAFSGNNGQSPMYGSLLAIEQKINVPDDNFEAYLEANGMGDGIANNHEVLYGNISTVTTLDISGKNIADLTGLEYFAALENLNCSNNNLAMLNVKSNTSLHLLDCSNNKLTFLNISSNTALTALRCNNNLLSQLNVNNGNNTAFTDFNITGNPYLFCVKVDDPAYSSANWPQKDAQTGYGNGCHYVTLLPGVNIDPILPLVSGAVYSISPALPAGLSFNTSTGTITGMPATVSAPAYYTITADGSQSAGFTLEVKQLSAIAARSVQYRGTYSSDDKQVNVYELGVYSNGVNVALNKPGSSNSYEYGDWSSNGANAVDGCGNSRNSSNRNNPVTGTGSPVILTINLSDNGGYNIDNIAVYSEGWTVDYTLYISEDNMNWIKYGEVVHGTGVWSGDQPSYSGNPSITAVSPASGTPGTKVTITGTGLSFTKTVTFGGVPAASFTVNSSTQITAVIGAGTPAGLTEVSVTDACNSWGLQASSGPVITVNTKIYVNDDASGANNGVSWADAYTDFQTAIDAAIAGDSIFVAAGTYQRINNGESFSMKEGVKIFGGFAGTEANLSERNPGSNISTLQGNGNSVIRNDYNGLTAAAVLNGFTISGGSVTNGTGGGMMNNGASPTITNCIFSGNTANSSSYGGGMYNSNNSSPIITNCIFSGNSADYGGGMYNTLSSPVITNSTFSGNNATTDGGSMYNANSSNPVITNSILWGNSSGIINSSSVATVTYSITDDITSGNGNVHADPQFINAPSASAAPITSGDYRLPSCSPAINAGSNIVYSSSQPVDLSAITMDIAGVARIQLGRADMGAYESNVAVNIASVASGNMVVDNIQSSDTITYYGNHCNEIVAAVAGNGAYPVNGNTTVKVWIETTQPLNFVKRHYEIMPANGTTGRITLYFTQQDFNDFNSISGTKLPQDPADNAGIANIRIEKRSGISSDNTGLPGSYPANAPEEILNNELQIEWNAAASRWEISFNVTSFSGFFVKTIEGNLSLNLLDFKVKEKDCTTIVDWTTTEETNVAGFGIQESSNGISFNSIKTVNARNTSGTNKYTINLPAAKGKTFYRLKMTDIDGTIKYSNVSVVTPNCNNNITIYPNPAIDKIFIQSQTTGNVYTIYDNSGKKVAAGRIDKTIKEINIENLASGIFYMIVDGKSYKIIKGKQ